MKLSEQLQQVIVLLNKITENVEDDEDILDPIGEAIAYLGDAAKRAESKETE